jgi:prepilin-type N-terminal cleavage/methylation domain-containing protein
MKKLQPQSGFSLVETLVAITILLVVIVTPLAITTSSSRSSSFSSEQVNAFFLAQEGLELAQKARDDLLVPYFAGTNPDPWADFTRTTNAGLYRNCYINKSVGDSDIGCDFTINSDTAGTLTVTTCTGSNACQLYIDKNTSSLRSRYTHSSTNNISTPFTRVVSLERISADEVKVVSKVTWRTGSMRQSQSVTAETYLMNMYGF